MRVESARAGSAYRARLGCGAALLTGIAVFVVVSLVAAVLFVLSAGGTSGAASFIRSQPGALPWNGKQRLTVLLLGQSASSGATNGMMLVSVDPTTRTLSLLSIPANLWVSIPGYGQDRISQAYADGGPRLALLTAESVTHVPIPYYAVVDSGALRTMIDDVGGITLRRAGRGGRGRHLSGAAALAYLARGSKGGPGAMWREHNILLALGAQTQQPQIVFQIPTVVNSLGGHVPTNFPYSQVPVLIHLLGSIHGTRLQRGVLDTANGAVAGAAGTTGVLVGDWVRIAAVARRFIPTPGLGAGPAVDVLNGSGASGEAAGLAQWLQESGVPVSGYASADSSDYPHTEVIVSRRAGSHLWQKAQDIATLLQAPLVRRGAGGGSPKGGAASPIVVLIGHDFHDLTQQ